MAGRAVVGGLAAAVLLIGALAGGAGLRAASPSETVTIKFRPGHPGRGGHRAVLRQPSPLPSGPGTATSTLSAPYGTVTTTWSVPAEITAGATATLRLQIQPAAGQRGSGYIVIKAPSEFGTAPGPFELYGAVEPGQSYDRSLNFTFTPTRKFTAGESQFIIVGNGCTGYKYEYRGTAAATAPAAQAPAGGECSVDIFLRRTFGEEIHDPEAGFGG